MFGARGMAFDVCKVPWFQQQAQQLTRSKPQRYCVALSDNGGWCCSTQIRVPSRMKLPCRITTMPSCAHGMHAVSCAKQKQMPDSLPSSSTCTGTACSAVSGDHQHLNDESASVGPVALFDAVHVCDAHIVADAHVGVQDSIPVATSERMSVNTRLGSGPLRTRVSLSGPRL